MSKSEDFSLEIWYNKNISSVKDEFVNTVDKITWLYKLSEDTIGANKTKKIEEIQVFEISLKEKKIPKNVIKTISKGILYQILYVIKYNNDTCYGIIVDDFYYTAWNEKVNISFHGLTLENIYENIVKSIINKTNSTEDFDKLLEHKSKELELTKKAEQLQNKIKQENQFNKKVGLNLELNKLNQEMEDLNNE